ncbi:phage integrase SAM-like domain-containing protein [Spirosoma sp. BT702]|uniref:Phage integrase SAM-like domain-containing protein n=1 Tax=Spirosoma profusum TaxID=2771354 RepID=A0A926XZI0_9BACT|nr:phage integrase SAM-like domain-containing protein [Spirosoma profusum]MBD2703809.1 phage integrase SAM-like domain-containing protein [Spirosoma profusum]
MFKSIVNKLTFCFRIRSKQTSGEVMLYCRLGLNGERTTEYRTGICVTLDVWKRKQELLQEACSEALKLHLQLDQFRSQHEQILQSQKIIAPLPRANTVRQAWSRQHLPNLRASDGLNVPNPHLSLRVVYQDYITHLDTRPKEERKADKTRASYRMAGQHLNTFLNKKRQPGFLAEQITPGFGMQFYDYLREKSINADTANRYLTFVKAALHHALLYDRIQVNGLFQFKPPRGNPAKRIVFLSETALAELKVLPLIGIRDIVRKWALFMCYTGLDYNDALKVVTHESVFRVNTPYGDKWVYQRLKLRHAPAWGECHIPILPQAQELFRELAKGKRPRLKVINTHLKEIAQKLQLPFEFCSKVCRKTAGVVFLKEGYSMPSIQKILGHQSLSMTERHYLTIQSFVVDSDMAKIRQSPANGNNAFTHIYKAS